MSDYVAPIDHPSIALPAGSELLSAVGPDGLIHLNVNGVTPKKNIAKYRPAWGLVHRQYPISDQTAAFSVPSDFFVYEASTQVSDVVTFVDERNSAGIFSPQSREANSIAPQMGRMAAVPQSAIVSSFGNEGSPTPNRGTRSYRAADVEDAWTIVDGKIEVWSKLEAGWDDDGAPPLSGKTLEQAASLISTARLLSCPSASISLSQDAELVFFWEKDDGFASIEFLPNGKIYAFARAPQDREPYRGEAETLAKLELLPFLNQLQKFRL